MYRLIIMSVGLLLFVYYMHVIAYLFGLLDIKTKKKKTFFKSLIPFYCWFNLK